MVISVGFELFFPQHLSAVEWLRGVVLRCGHSSTVSNMTRSIRCMHVKQMILK